MIGADRAGEKLVEMATERGLGIAAVCVDSERPTSTNTRVIARSALLQLSLKGRRHPGSICFALTESLNKKFLIEYRSIC